ncbi:MAG: dienelactone hydrolase family protein [Spirochaetota bacterium]|nr:dienelactone hydrolase family protein [Spirochaetota bacterium]
MKGFIVVILVFTLLSCGKTKGTEDKSDKNQESKLFMENITTKSIEYFDGKTVLEGYLAYDSSLKGKRPGVLVAHAWMGLDEYAKRRARQLASLGYVAFALDIYGKGVRAKDHKEAMKLSGIYRNNKDRSLMRSRAGAGLQQLVNHELTNKNQVAAIGYCFGGATVLELARSGGDLKGIVTFHGSLSTPHRDDAKNIKGQVIILHGSDDPHISNEEISNFRDEMREAQVNMRFVSFAGAKHAFTVPSANNPKMGLEYNQLADEESWSIMQSFFNEIFKRNDQKKNQPVKDKSVSQ